MGFGIKELIVVLIIVLLLFGTKKLKNIGGDLGSAIKGFRKSMNDDDDPKTAALEEKNVEESTLDTPEADNEEVPKADSQTKSNSKA